MSTSASAASKAAHPSHLGRDTPQTLSHVQLAPDLDAIPPLRFDPAREYRRDTDRADRDLTSSDYSAPTSQSHLDPDQDATIEDLIILASSAVFVVGLVSIGRTVARGLKAVVGVPG